MYRIHFQFPYVTTSWWGLLTLIVFIINTPEVLYQNSDLQCSDCETSRIFTDQLWTVQFIRKGTKWYNSLPFKIKHLCTNNEQYTKVLHEIILAHCTVAVDLFTVIVCIKYVLWIWFYVGHTVSAFTEWKKINAGILNGNYLLWRESVYFLTFQVMLPFPLTIPYMCITLHTLIRV
jgi:hypothetical protein